MNILCIDEQNSHPELFCRIAQCFGAQCIAMSWNDFLGTDKARLPSEIANAVWKLVSSREIAVVLAIQTPFSLRIMSILAASMGVPLLGSLKTSGLADGIRSICAARLLERIMMPERPFCATILDDGMPQKSDIYVTGQLPVYQPIPQPEGCFVPFGENKIPLNGARIVFAGGRGLGAKEYFEKMGLCAQKFGAAVASSRLAVDLGWTQNDMQVGQTGKCISPDIYVAFGISGAVQHVAGIQNARFIYAINSDRDAPIFSFANAGVVADARLIIDKLLAI